MAGAVEVGTWADGVEGVPSRASRLRRIWEVSVWPDQSVDEVTLSASLSCCCPPPGPLSLPRSPDGADMVAER